jgi:alpha-beta hydrolase superfamily lysophospholipase
VTILSLLKVPRDNNEKCTNDPKFRMMKHLTLKMNNNCGNQSVLHYYSWAPDKAIGWVHIIHGMSEHALRYFEVAQFLADSGYIVTADDHRGHGKTGVSSNSLAHLADQKGWQLLLQDQMALLKTINKSNGRKAFVLGHSMGAAISLALCQNYASEFRHLAAGIILSGSWYASSTSYRPASAIARFERARLGPRHPSNLLHYLSFGNFNRSFKPYETEADWLSRDKRKVLDYVADPLCGFPLTTQSWVDFLDGLIQLFKKTSLCKIDPELPFYLISGDEDPVGGKGTKVKDLFCKLSETGIEDIKMTLYIGSRHEVFNETNRREVCFDIKRWMDRILNR